MTHPTSTHQILPVLISNQRRFFEFLRRRVGSSHDAEEILQSALARAVENEVDIPEERATAWFYRVLRNALTDHYRRRAAESKALAVWGTEYGDAVTTDRELADVVCACVDSLLSTLKPEYAELLTRVESQDLPVSAAAEALKISPNNASVRLHRARAALKQRLLETCRTCANHGCLDCTCQKKSETRV